MIIKLIISVVLLTIIVIYAIRERVAERNELKEAYNKYLKDQTDLQCLLVKHQKDWNPVLNKLEDELNAFDK